MNSVYMNKLQQRLMEANNNSRREDLRFVREDPATVLEVWDPDDVAAGNLPKDVARKTKESSGLLWARLQNLRDNRTYLLPYVGTLEEAYSFGDSMSLVGRDAIIRYKGTHAEDGKWALARTRVGEQISLNDAVETYDIISLV